MKSFVKLLIVASIMLCGAFVASAQVPAQVSAAKVGFVKSTQFSNPTGGINRLTAALRQLEAEFKQRRDDIAASIARFDELQKVPANLTEAQLLARQDQAQTLQIEITRKQEDARSAYGKRFAQLTDPLQKSINDSLKVFARSRGIDVLIDASKFPDGVMIVNEGTDLTAAFVRDYNTKNP